MLLNLNKQTWMDSLGLMRFSAHCEKNHASMATVLKLAKLYKKVIFITDIFAYIMMNE